MRRVGILVVTWFVAGVAGVATADPLAIHLEKVFETALAQRLPPLVTTLPKPQPIDVPAAPARSSDLDATTEPRDLSPGTTKMTCLVPERGALQCRCVARPRVKP